MMLNGKQTRHLTLPLWKALIKHVDGQKRAEQQLKASEENFRVLAETVPQLVWTAQPDGSHEYTNQRWRDYTGFTPERVQRWDHLQFLHPDDRARNQALWRHALDTGERFECEGRLRNGQTGVYRWVLTRAMPVRDEAGQIIKWFGTCTDIEDQKRIEEALRQSQERVNALMNSNIIGINVIEGEQIVDANDTFLRMTGYTREDLRAGRINVMHMTAPEDRAQTQQAHQELAVRQALTPYEKEYICQDGSRLPVLVGGVVLQHDPFQALGFVLDNSAHKELEQRKDHFLGMASHELKTPIASLMLQTQLLRKQLAKQDIHNADRALSRMESQLNAVTRLVGELLDLSKIQAGKLEHAQETVNLGDVLQEVVEIVQQTQTTHAIVVHHAEHPPLLIGNKDRLGQVLLNLISNAIKYSPGANTIEVAIETSEESVILSVCDHGIGIPREQREKIFERFYRAVAPYQHAFPGLGMGLHIASEIVKHHRGTITVESEMGKGSTFQVTLPRKSP
ncbi:ATP-binding protein [Ktedonobacter sp. SOSP1-85]|uniref:PAS domain-containing sensor histidine kinase n=1 Tax=Ktedonobacter sp. SOSP1-85 TaxID=2778367 RepID=UPI0035B3D51E